MNSFSFCLKIATFSLLIWIFQVFFTYNSKKSVFNKGIIKTKLGLEYKRTLAEAAIEYIDEGCDLDQGREGVPVEKEKKKVQQKVSLSDDNEDEKKVEGEGEEENVEEGDQEENLEEDDDEEDETEELFKFYTEVSEVWNERITSMWNKFREITKGMDTNWRAKKWYHDWHKRVSFENFKMDVVIFESQFPLDQKKSIFYESLENADSDFKEFCNECIEEWNKKAKFESEKIKAQKKALRRADEADRERKEQKSEDKEDAQVASSQSTEVDKHEKKRFYVHLSHTWNAAIKTMWKDYLDKTKNIDDKWRRNKWSDEWHKHIVEEKTELQMKFIEDNLSLEERRKLFEEWLHKTVEKFSLFVDECKQKWEEAEQN